MNHTQKFALLAITAGLVACGGGGDTSSTVGAALPPASSSTVTVADALVELNRLRASAGFGAFSRSAELEKAAQSHLAYTARWYASDGFSHNEEPLKAGFTGVTPSDRGVAAGYSAGAGEVAAAGGPSSTPITHIQGLMNSPFHGMGLLTGAPDIGIAYQMISATTSFLIADFGARPNAFVQVPPNEVRMWPCNGVAGILNKTINEEVPAPIPGRNLIADPIGTPLYVVVTSSNALVLSSYELRNAKTNAVEAIAKVVGQTPGPGLPVSKMAVLPNQPLALSTEYIASVTGLNAGISFTKTCRFTTVS